MFGYTWKLRGVVFLYNVAVVFFALALGYLYSYIQEIHPFKPILLALIISFVVGQFLFPKFIKRYLANKK